MTTLPDIPLPSTIRSRYVEDINGLRMHVLEAGFEDRLRLAFVELEEERDPTPAAAPVLIVPGQEYAFTHRDREDELEAVARRIESTGGVGLVVARPLPYLYLAREVFAGAGIAFEAPDALPLAAEAYAAAVDLVLECAAANFTRRALTALLRSPHFEFTADGVTVDRPSIAALDQLMAERRYLGGLDRLQSLVDPADGPEKTAARAALAIATALSPLTESRPMTDQLELLRGFLDSHDKRPSVPDPQSLAGTAARRARVRAAVMHALDGMSNAYRRHDPSAVGTVTELSAAVRRWLGGQTFALGITPRRHDSGGARRGSSSVR